MTWHPLTIHTPMEENESIPIGFETVEPETVEIHEDASMLDVHLPHGTLHGWRDFWIHLGTITLGLLIAISLEQSVEWVHHLHQRHELEADLRQEGVQGQSLAEADWRVMDERMAVITAKLRQVESTLAIRRKAPAPYPASSFMAPPPAGNGFFVSPLETVWTTAKESALIELLPRETARDYTRVYFQIDALHSALAAEGVVGDEVAGYECRFSDGTLPCKLDFARATDEQLEEYAGLLAKYFRLMTGVKSRVLLFEATNGQMLNIGSVGGAVEVFDKLRAAHPDTFLHSTPVVK